MSYTKILHLFLLFSLLFFVSSCGKKDIPEESSGAVSEQTDSPELNQEMADRLKLLENQNTPTTNLGTIGEQISVETELSVKEKESEINTSETPTSTSNSEITQGVVASSSNNNTAPEKDAVASAPAPQENTTISNQNTPVAVNTPVEVAPTPTPAPIPDIPEPVILIQDTSETQQELSTPQIETPASVEKNIIQKVVDTVVNVTKSVVETIKNIVTPKSKTEGIVSSAPTPTSTTPPVETPVIPTPQVPTGSTGSTSVSNTGSTGNPTVNSQSGATQTTQSGTTNTPTNPNPVIPNIPTPPQVGSGVVDTPPIDDDPLETTAAIIIEEVDENAGIAQFSQGNFSGLDKSNPINLTTENGLPLILYQFTLNQTLTSPTLIVGKIQKNFVFDGLFGVQIYNANNEKVKDWYATTFFSQDAGDEEKGMVYFLIELVYDENFGNKTATGYIRFIVDNPTSNTSKDDYIDIPVKFPL